MVSFSIFSNHRDYLPEISFSSYTYLHGMIVLPKALMLIVPNRRFLTEFLIVGINDNRFQIHYPPCFY